MRIRSLLSALFTVLLAIAMMGGGGLLSTAHAQQNEDLAELLEYEENTIEIYQRYGPSVVAISVEVQGTAVGPLEGIPEEEIPEWFRRFIPQLPQPEQPQPRTGSGSGFVIDEEGHVITNYHVVQAALVEDGVELREGAEITVIFPTTNQAVPARVVGANALYDLALLELIDLENLPEEVQDILPIPIMTAGEVQVGQKVIAIGNPFGFENTVTTGTVSGVSRSLPGVGQIDIPLIQTDAAINPGNSGGPLLSSGGEVIGVNTAIIPQIGITGQAGFLGIGFAVPSTVLADNLEALRAGGLVDLSTRARLGVGVIEVGAYPEQVQEALNLPDEGVAIIQVQPGGAAAEAGLRGPQFEVSINGQQIPAGGDIIVAVDGETVESASELQRLIFEREEGETVELTLWRDGEEVEVPVTLSVVGEEDEQAEGQGEG